MIRAQSPSQNDSTPQFVSLIFRARTARNGGPLHSADLYRNEAVSVMTGHLTKHAKSLAYHHHIDVDEVTSALFEKAWLIVEQLIAGDRKLPKHLGAYARRVAHFTAVSLQRRDCSENQMRKTLAEIAATDVWFGTAVDSTLSDQDDVRWILDGLSESDRLVLCLPVMGYDDYEIGQRLGGALPNAVHKRRSDARQRARLRRDQLAVTAMDRTNTTGEDANA